MAVVSRFHKPEGLSGGLDQLKFTCRSAVTVASNLIEPTHGFEDHVGVYISTSSQQRSWLPSSISGLSATGASLQERVIFISIQGRHAPWRYPRILVVSTFHLTGAVELAVIQL